MINEEIKQISLAIAEKVKPLRIILFGSYAKDQNTPDSDYDIYILMPDDTADIIEVEQNAYKSIRKIRKTPVDIVAGTKSMFESRSLYPTLERNVKNEGIAIYG